MPTSICVVGAGVIGLSCALHLAQAGHQVTILARDLPGDEGPDWCSPWAGAVFLPKQGDPGAMHRALIANSLAWFQQLALHHPESGVQLVALTSFHDNRVDDEDLWYREIMPGYKVLPQDELAPGTSFGMTCSSVTINPALYLPWLLAEASKQGVAVRRWAATSLADARRACQATVVVNASGLGAAKLASDDPDTVMPVCGQTLFIPAPGFDRVVIREGREYTYVIPRMGTGGVILGGVRQEGSLDTRVDEQLREDILRRVNVLTKEAFSHIEPREQVIRDIVGLRPGRKGGPRIVRDGDTIHTYGFDGEGHLYSWGVAQEVQRLVAEATAATQPKL